ncbi:MAG: hypothetical protein L0207_06120 [Chlamydiae bacterium]|nr:hypothetical protein [Chlamydiota bacterium]
MTLKLITNYIESFNPEILKLVKADSIKTTSDLTNILWETDYSLFKFLPDAIATITNPGKIDLSAKNIANIGLTLAKTTERGATLVKSVEKFIPIAIPVITLELAIHGSRLFIFGSDYLTSIYNLSQTESSITSQENMVLHLKMAESALVILASLIELAFLGEMTMAIIAVKIAFVTGSIIAGKVRLLIEKKQVVNDIAKETTKTAAVIAATAAVTEVINSEGLFSKIKDAVFGKSTKSEEKSTPALIDEPKKVEEVLESRSSVKIEEEKEETPTSPVEVKEDPVFEEVYEEKIEMSNVWNNPIVKPKLEKTIEIVTQQLDKQPLSPEKEEQVKRRILMLARHLNFKV